MSEYFWQYSVDYWSYHLESILMVIKQSLLINTKVLKLIIKGTVKSKTVYGEL